MMTKSKHRKSRMVAIISMATASVFAVHAAMPTLSNVHAEIDTSAEGKYYADFNSFEEEQEYAAELNAQILAESTILLKNKNNALPLSSKQKNISLFGYRSYNIFTGGIGSGEVKGESKTLTQSLTSAGFKVNPRLAYLYSYQYDKRTISTHEAAVNFDQTVEVNPDFVSTAKSSFNLYGDAAIFTIGRNGGEADDVMMANVPTHTDKTDHYLQLDDNEKKLLAMIKEWKSAGYFKTVIILINSGNTVQIPELEDDDNIDAILWMGFPGNDGIMGLGKILNGEISPSGRTVDVWAANFKTDPTWFNMGGSEPFITSSDDPAKFRYNDVFKSNGEKDGKTDNLQYEEGIYVGYRWYETAAVTTAAGEMVSSASPSTTDSVLKSEAVHYEASKDTYTGNDIYYNRSTGVVYPFGYGLSYTSFSQKIVDTDVAKINKTLSEGKLSDTFKVEVEVRNTGSVAGKEVVELYVEQPYKGTVEKAARVLVGYAKTEILEPNEKQVVAVEVRVQDVASFDYNNASGLFAEKAGGYVLEGGDYKFKLMANSHKEATAASGGIIEISTTLGDIVFDAAGDPKNVFSQGDEYDTLLVTKTYSDPTADYGVKGDAMTVMSRSSFGTTFPTPPTVNSQTYSDKIFDITKRYLSVVDSSTWDKPTDPWYNVAVPTEWKQDQSSNLMLADLAGLSYNDSKWTELMNKMSWSDLVAVVSSGGFSVPAVESIGREASFAEDGPAQLGDDGTAWCCDTNIAATWNTELAEQMGIMMGNESIYLGVSGWYGPGANTHRSPFGGRNYEYYSSDGVHAGYIAAAVTRGASSKGTLIYLKHFAVNDSESNRETVDTWLSEQSMREIYLKSFELAYTVGNCTGCMTSFNRVGAVPASGNYYLEQRIMREEWGFNGVIITDAYGGRVCAFAGVMQRTGNTAPLGDYETPSTAKDAPAPGPGGPGGVTQDPNMIYGSWDSTKNTVVDSTGAEWDIQYYWIRQAAKTFLFAQANSNAVKNRLAISSFSGNEDVTIYTGAKTEKDLGVPSADLGTAYGTYQITSGELPAGLKLDSLTGKISGVASALPGSEGRVEITLTADGCYKSTKTFNFSVADPFGVTGFATPTAGANATGAIGSTVIKADVKQFWSESPMSSEWHEHGRMYVHYESSDLPDGLTMDIDGNITGTYPAAGIYVFNVDIEIEDKELVLLFGKSVVGQTYTYTDFTRTYTLKVGGADAGIYAGDLTQNSGNDEEIQFRLIDGVLQFKKGDGEWVSVLNGNDGAAGSNDNGGVVVGIVLALVAMTFALAGVGGCAYIILKRKKQ